MKEPTYRVEWQEVGGDRQSEDFDDRMKAFSYREFLKLTKTILWSSVCKVEER